ncbi:hypothetical protein QE152_g26346 [Popillia japonica]|uniref:Uncharacterized protein n=1 Tax=Popillia japonica TaxID=7064 RepID=A0AAW1JXU5_POPJA
MEQLHLPSFHCNEELSNLGTKWKKWKRSFEILIQAKGIDNHVRKKNLLLHLAGSQVQDIYFTLPASENTSSPDLYTVTMDGLDAYFAPKINTVYERYLFRSLRQAQNDAYFAPKINTVYERYLFRSLRQAQNETVVHYEIKGTGKTMRIYRLR